MIQFDDNTKYQKEGAEDSYMRAFLENASLRPSCYRCNFKDPNKVSDITIGDFWGVENIYPEGQKYKGVSLCLINSKSGSDFFDNEIVSSNNNYWVRKVNIEAALKYNSAALNSVLLPRRKRDALFNLLQKNTFSLEHMTECLMNRKIDRIIMIWERGTRKIKRLLKITNKPRLVKEDNLVAFKNKYLCTGCSACFSACPKEAITMEEDIEGFKYPTINLKKCINCGFCLQICPANIKTNGGDK